MYLNVLAAWLCSAGSRFSMWNLDVLHFTSYLVCSHGLNGDPVFGYVSERLVDLIYFIISTVDGNVSVQFDLKSFCFNLTCN